MAFTTFVYDTLDVCTRLGRYIIQELTGWHDARGRWLGTASDRRRAAVLRDANGRLTPKGNRSRSGGLFWALFGASNQLLGGADAAWRHGLAVADAQRNGGSGS